MRENFSITWGPPQGKAAETRSYRNNLESQTETGEEKWGEREGEKEKKLRDGEIGK